MSTIKVISLLIVIVFHTYIFTYLSFLLYLIFFQLFCVYVLPFFFFFFSYIFFSFLINIICVYNNHYNDNREFLMGKSATAFLIVWLVSFKRNSFILCIIYLIKYSTIIIRT